MYQPAFPALRSFDGITPTLGARVLIDPAATVIGDVVLGDDSSVWPAAVVRGDVNSIRVGARTSVQDGAVLHVSHRGPLTPNGFPLVVGDDVTIGHRVTLHGCTVGSRVIVGMGAIVLDGAVIEDDVVLAAGSLVPPGKRLESGFMYKGSPAQKARPLTAEEMAYFTYTAGHYVRLKDKYLAGQGLYQACDPT